MCSADGAGGQSYVIVVDALLRLGISLKSWIMSGMLRVGGCMISSAMSALSSGDWIGCGKW
jgi:hypothetical protein